MSKDPSIFMILTLGVSETKEIINAALSSLTNFTQVSVFSPG